MMPKVGAVYQYDTYVLECLSLLKSGLVKFKVLVDGDDHVLEDEIVNLTFYGAFVELPHYKVMKEFDKDLEELLNEA